MRISILIPAHNEEQCLEATLRAALRQTRPADEIVVVNDGSTDRTGEIIRSFGTQVKGVHIPVATGNKSHAQEIGLRYITGDVFIALDGDTLLNEHFVERVERAFLHPEINAFSGYIESLRHNAMTACREIDYFIGQVIYKNAQAFFQYLFVIPGCAAAYRTEVFRTLVRFDHDTITEDLDFTYQLHERGIRIHFDQKAIVYTQDPPTLHSYINQMRRWFGGGWQNLMKHWRIIKEPAAALELSLMYGEGLLSALLLFILPFVNIYFFFFYLAGNIFFGMLMGVIAGIVRRRMDVILVAPLYPLLTFINAYIFLEQAFLEVILRRRHMQWFSPVRTAISF